MQYEDDIAEFNNETKRLLESLPRKDMVPSVESDALVNALADEGFITSHRGLARRSVPYRAILLVAASIVLLASGFTAGARWESRGSLEAALARTDLSVNDRLILLQRAGSTYVTAAQQYASATAHVDSTAVEVASQVLIGAAHAVARSDLDGGLAPRLTAALASAHTRVNPPTSPPLLWY